MIDRAGQLERAAKIFFRRGSIAQTQVKVAGIRETFDQLLFHASLLVSLQRATIFVERVVVFTELHERAAFSFARISFFFRQAGFAGQLYGAIESLHRFRKPSQSRVTKSDFFEILSNPDL